MTGAEPSARGPLLELRALTAERRGVRILDNVSLEVQRGDCCALVGPNGAGKSTLLEALIGATPISSGAAMLEARPLESISERERARLLALVGREQSHDLELTVGEVAALGRLPHLGIWQGMGPGDLAIVNAALEATGAASFAQRPMSSLSDGERQRVHVARALAQQPRVLLMDEATAHLDLASRHEALRLVRDFCSQGGAALVVVHDLDIAVRYATQVAVLDGGRIVGGGKPEDVFTRELLRAVFRVDAELRHWERGSVLQVYGPAGPERKDPLPS